MSPSRHPARARTAEGDATAAVEHAIAELAGRQHGRVGRTQLRDLGLTLRQIRTRRERGWLREEHPGVYAVGHQAPSRLGGQMAAVLSCGDDGFLSHWAAKGVWELRRVPRGVPIDVTVPGRQLRPRRGVRMHRSSLPFADRTVTHGLPVTTPARTIVDLAAVASPYEVGRAFEEGRRRGLATAEAVEDVLCRRRGSRGAAVVAMLLTDLRPPQRTRSEMERRLLELVRAAELPEPVANLRVGPYELDLAWPALKVAAEYDSWIFHGSPEAQSRDAVKRARLEPMGWLILGVPERRMERRPLAVIADLARAIGARQAAAA